MPEDLNTNNNKPTEPPTDNSNIPVSPSDTPLFKHEKKRVGRPPKNPNYVPKPKPVISEQSSAPLEESTKRAFDQDLDIIELFVDVEERKLAKRLLKKYLDDYTIETISDKNTLKQLIYLEVIQVTRLQKAANDTKTMNDATPIHLLRAIQDNINQILILKDKLGLTREKTKEILTGFNALESMKKKFKAWREQNQGSRSLICPHCGRMTLLKIRMDMWEAQKHPFFRDRILGNTHLIRLYKEGKLTKEDIAAVLETSVDYIERLIQKWKTDSV